MGTPRPGFEAIPDAVGEGGRRSLRGSSGTAISNTQGSLILSDVAVVSFRPNAGLDFDARSRSTTCVVQPTVCTTDDNELAVALYAVVLRLARLPVDEPVDKAGLAVLHETYRLGPVRPSDLAAQMHLDLSTISRHLRSLEQQGMVARISDPDDARAQQISLTTRGRDVLTLMLDHRSAAIRDAIAHWPEDDRRALRRLLRRLAEDLSDQPVPLATGGAKVPART
jgi:DNA-binding MarR family transcriptional regulator